jgi:hypothetical protein
MFRHRFEPSTCRDYLSIYLSFFLYSCCSHWEHRASVKRFVSLQFLNPRQSVGLLGRRSAHRKAAIYTGQHAQNKRTQISITWVEFETTIPVLERAKSFHTSNQTAGTLWLIPETLVTKIRKLNKPSNSQVYATCRNHLLDVGFEVLTPVVTKSTIFWDITPCSQPTFRRNTFASILLGLFLDPEDGKCSSETSVDTRCYIPEGRALQLPDVFRSQKCLSCL